LRYFSAGIGTMIGKPLRERNALAPLSDERAVAVMLERLTPDAAALIEVRKQNAKMIACLIVRADQTTLRMCRALGLRMTLGGTGVVGLLGADAAQFFSQLPASKRAWLETPCGPRETKVLLVAGGIATLSLQTEGGKVTVTAVA
jgi:hypothetical protein